LASLSWKSPRPTAKSARQIGLSSPGRFPDLASSCFAGDCLGA
jgi:hypothetical protein